MVQSKRKESIYEQHPWIALNIYRAFNEAKQQSQAIATDWASSQQMLGAVEQNATLNVDPFPYGVKAILKSLETLTQYIQEQHLVNRRVSVDEIFAKNMLDL